MIKFIQVVSVAFVFAVASFDGASQAFTKRL